MLNIAYFTCLQLYTPEKERSKQFVKVRLPRLDHFHRFSFVNLEAQQIQSIRLLFSILTDIILNPQHQENVCAQRENELQPLSRQCMSFILSVVILASFPIWGFFMLSTTFTLRQFDSFRYRNVKL